MKNDVGYADIIDNCPAVYNPSQMDWDHDGIGNVCDSDCPDLDGGAIVVCGLFASCEGLEADGVFACGGPEQR